MTRQSEMCLALKGNKSLHTFNAKMVLPSFNLHRLTAPPAPSPRLPSSMIFFCSLAASHPSSSKSSTSNGRPFSRLSLSKSGSNEFTLPSLSIETPPSELIVDDGSGVPPAGCRRPMAKDRAEYDDAVDLVSMLWSLPPPSDEPATG